MGAGDLFRRTQFFVAFCAATMGIQTFIVTENNINSIAIIIIFLSALFIYNTSLLNFSLYRKEDKFLYTIKLKGEVMPIVICSFSLLMLMLLLTRCDHFQLLVFLTTGAMSFFYMMPFNKNGEQLPGLRNSLILKNVILSVIWASCTVLFPLSGYDTNCTGQEILFLFLRRFFFIYALTVVYDLRDRESDTHAGMQTIALKLGTNRTKVVALIAMALFVLIVLIDPLFNESALNHYGLLISSIPTTIIILATNTKRNKAWYSFVVDGAMPLQLLIILLLSHT